MQLHGLPSQRSQNRSITGAGRGIGRAIARLFAKEGASVFLTARTQEELAATTKEIIDNGGQAAFATADVSKEEDCRRIVAAAREKFGPITILVNNAGHYGPVVPVEDYPARRIRQRHRHPPARRIRPDAIGSARNVRQRARRHS